MKKCFYIIFLFLPSILFGALINNPDSVKNTIQSLDSNEKALSYIELAKYYTYAELDSVNLEYITKAYQTATDKETKGLALFWEAFIHLYYKNDEKHLAYLDKAIAEFESVNDSLLAESYYWKTRTYERKGLYPEALATGLQCLGIAQKLPAKDKQILYIQEVGYIYDRMGEFDKAIEWYEKGLIIALETEKKEHIGKSYGLLGIAYDAQENYKQALENNLNAVKYFLEAQDTSNLIVWYSNIGNTYTKMGDLKNAEQYLLKSINTSKKYKSRITGINLGKVYIEQGKYAEAEEILQSSLKTVIENNDKQFESEAYYRLHELRKKQGRYDEALEYYVKYKDLQDEILNTEKFEQLNNMTVRYETQEKEKALAQEKLKVTERELKIENKNNQLLIISIVFITLALLGFIFINQQRFKNKQLEREKELNTALAKIETNNKLQNQRLEISRDLHDSIGSQLTFIISSIENLKMFLTNSDNFVGDKLSSLSEFTKDTIQELRDTIWAMNKNEISIEDLNTRISNFINQAKVSLQNINFSFNSSVPENTNFESKKGMHIYRIIQESVNNAIKHSDASEIKVSITQNDKENMIQIEDNGKGFNIDENLNKGNGLNSLRKRAEEIQGKLYIESAKNKTTITLITKTL